jgi:hypothetical protein
MPQVLSELPDLSAKRQVVHRQLTQHQIGAIQSGSLRVEAPEDQRRSGSGHRRNNREGNLKVRNPLRLKDLLKGGVDALLVACVLAPKLFLELISPLSEPICLPLRRAQ